MVKNHVRSVREYGKTSARIRPGNFLRRDTMTTLERLTAFFEPMVDLSPLTAIMLSIGMAISVGAGIWILTASRKP